MTANDLQYELDLMIDLCRRKGVVQFKTDRYEFILGPEPKDPDVEQRPFDDGKAGPDGLTKTEQEELYYSSGG